MPIKEPPEAEVAKAGGSDEEIEVTPIMIEAGRCAYYRVPSFQGDAPLEHDEQVAAIFRAMVQARRP